MVVVTPPKEQLLAPAPLQTALNQAGAGPRAPTACLRARAPVSLACPRAQFSSTGALGGTQVSGERTLSPRPSLLSAALPQGAAVATHTDTSSLRENLA